MLDLNHKFWNKKYKKLYDSLGEKKYSEHQEDGIIEAVFKKYKPKYRYFVDVGAFGQRSSNTWALMEQGWGGLMIEEKKEESLEIARTINFTNTKYIKQTVTQDNLDDILLSNNVPYDFDFLSVDVDSYEYEIWKNLSFKPKLVCIEVNQVEQDFDVLNYDPSFSVHPKAGNGYGGATIGLMNKLAKEKGYDYLCWDVSNAFYIRRDE